MLPAEDMTSEIPTDFLGTLDDCNSSVQVRINNRLVSILITGVQC